MEMTDGVARSRACLQLSRLLFKQLELVTIADGKGKKSVAMDTVAWFTCDPSKGNGASSMRTFGVVVPCHQGCGEAVTAESQWGGLFHLW